MAAAVGKPPRPAKPDDPPGPPEPDPVHAIFRLDPPIKPPVAAALVHPIFAHAPAPAALRLNLSPSGSANSLSKVLNTTFPSEPLIVQPTMQSMTQDVVRGRGSFPGAINPPKATSLQSWLAEPTGGALDGDLGRPEFTLGRPADQAVLYQGTYYAPSELYVDLDLIQKWWKRLQRCGNWLGTTETECFRVGSGPGGIKLRISFYDRCTLTEFLSCHGFRPATEVEHAVDVVRDPDRWVQPGPMDPVKRDDLRVVAWGEADDFEYPGDLPDGTKPKSQKTGGGIAVFVPDCKNLTSAQIESQEVTITECPNGLKGVKEILEVVNEFKTYAWREDKQTGHPVVTPVTKGAKPAGMALHDTPGTSRENLTRGAILGNIKHITIVERFVTWLCCDGTLLWPFEWSLTTEADYDCTRPGKLLSMNSTNSGASYIPAAGLGAMNLLFKNIFGKVPEEWCK